MEKTNRGIVLGALLLVGLILFICVKEIRFRQEIPDIRSQAQAYVEELLQLNVTPEGIGPEVSLTKEQKALLTDRLDRLMEKYWYFDVREKDILYNTPEIVKRNYEAYLDDGLYEVFYSVSVHIAGNDISVSQDGPDRAIVVLWCDNITVECVNREAYPFVGEVMYNTGDDGSSASKRFLASLQGQFCLEMQRVDGSWKVVGSDCYTVYISSEILDKEVTP